MNADDDRFEDEHGAALVQARYEIATEAVAEGMMLAAAGLKESTPYNTWQPLAHRFRSALTGAAGPGEVLAVALQNADRLAVALIELAARR